MTWDMKEALAYYRSQGAPGDQNALKNLLREVQEHSGGAVRPADLGKIAEAYGIKETLLLAVIRRSPSLRLSEEHLLELCAGPNCPRKRDLLGFVERTWGKKPAGFTVRTVPCMRQCGKGPNIRYDGMLYHGADEALLESLLPPARK